MAKIRLTTLALERCHVILLGFGVERVAQIKISAGAYEYLT